MTDRSGPDQRPLATLEYLMTLQQVADELGVTKERVRQIEQAALTKLRRQLHRRGYQRSDFFG